MDPPADHDGGEKRRTRPPQRSSSFPPPTRERVVGVGSRYVKLHLVLIFISFFLTCLVYDRILTPYWEVMTLSIDQPIRDDYNIEDKRHQQQQQSFHPTAFHKHVYLRQSSSTDNNFTNSTLFATTGTTKDSNYVRITFQFHDPKVVQLKNVYNPYMKCPIGKVMQRRDNRKATFPSGEIREGVLPPSLTRVSSSNEYTRNGRVLDFTATITTNLKILQIGDSVLVQLAQAFDEMVGCRTINGKEFCRPRDVLWEPWTGHNGRTIVSSTIGGGVSAMWRMTGLLTRRRQGKAPANAPGGGWSMPDVTSFWNHTIPLNEGNISDGEKEGKSTLHRFDAVVFRVMHGWMKSHEITHDRLVEAVELSHELLGAETVVLMTIPFTNNVLTADDMNEVNLINANMRHIAQGWHLRNSSGVKKVLVLEYGTYHNHIIWSNARHIGYNVSAPLLMTQEMFDLEGLSFLYDRLQIDTEWKPTIAQVCSEQNWLGTDKAKCNRNYLISDGMHICPETVATRYGVAVACLLGCVYNRKSAVDNQQRHDENKLRACERECNEQFMSVMPVDETWIDSNTELASFSND